MTDLFTSLIAGDINLITGLILLVVAILFSIVGGAIGGIMLAGKEFGYQFSATLGGLLAPAGVIPVVILGLVVLKVLIN
ncbi:hypothetical protein [Brasilonema bromeliae]|uniref:Uncharacterized protein n=1 Tax=Brasilonema bromeliae SPC951 TaxID=385972 RepID=A0ABX1PDM1_9CYAN|nr:hypothetical protein [Brasilonema bromeliae]NMG22073.1 hypothetical protein [Brasilonema bromeliae SPC951]